MSGRLCAASSEKLMPEQRRVKAGTTVVLPCYAVTQARWDGARTTRHITGRRRAQRDTRHDDVTGRKLRHSRRRATRQRASSYAWRRGDELIDAAVSGKFSVHPLDHSLTIHNASSTSDTAMYSCVRRHGNASTTDDVITSRQIQLVVEGKHVQFT